MASKYGVEYTKVLQTVPSEKALANKWNNPLRIMYDSYSLSADLAAGDKIYLGKLKKGDRVIDVIVSFADLDAAGGTINIGYEYNAANESSLTDDLDAFGAAVDVTSAATHNLAEGANLPGFGYEVEGDADIVVEIAGDTDAVTGTIKVAVVYAAA